MSRRPVPSCLSASHFCLVTRSPTSLPIQEATPAPAYLTAGGEVAEVDEVPAVRLFASDRSGARPGLEQRTRARSERRRKANDALRSRASRRSCLVRRISRTGPGLDRSKSRRFNRRGRGSDRLGRAGRATVCRDRHNCLPSSQTLKCWGGATFDATMPVDAPQSGGIHQTLRRRHCRNWLGRCLSVPMDERPISATCGPS